MSFPVLDAYTKSQTIPQFFVDDLRLVFLQRVAKNPELYYEEDIERVATNDWTVRRFLFNYSTKPDLSRGLEAIDRAMQWRKSFGVRDITCEHFPQELHISAGAIIYGTDLNGSPLFILRGKVSTRIKCWSKTLKSFLVHHIEKIDANSEQKGLTILVDCRDTGLQNADIDLIKFVYRVFNDYYPCLVNAFLVYKMPTVLEVVYRLCSTWVNDEQKKHVHLVSHENIDRFVATEQLPNFLMGTNPKPYRSVPESAPSAHELADRLAIDLAKADKLVRHLQRCYGN